MPLPSSAAARGKKVSWRRACGPLAADGFEFSVATTQSESRCSAKWRGKGAKEREERQAYFWGTHCPRRRAILSRPCGASVTSQSAVGEAVKRILSGRSKDFLTVPMICDIHFPAMQNPLFHRSPARKVLGAQRRRIGGLARARRSGLGARAASSSWISPSPPSDGGEGWGAEGRFYWFPLSSVLSPLVPRGERMESLMQPCAHPCGPAHESRPRGPHQSRHRSRGRR